MFSYEEVRKSYEGRRRQGSGVSDQILGSQQTQCLVGWGRGLHSHSCEGRRTAGPQRQTSTREAIASPAGLWNLVTLWSCPSRAKVSRPLDPSICQLSDKGCICVTLAEAVTPSKVNAQRDSAQGLSPWQ